MAILDDVKASLKIKNNYSDADISEAIESAKTELGLAGVEVISTDDNYTLSAIKMYCKGVFNFQNKSEIFLNQFEKVKQRMAIGHEYNGTDIDED